MNVSWRNTPVVRMLIEPLPMNSLIPSLRRQLVLFVVTAIALHAEINTPADGLHSDWHPKTTILDATQNNIVMGFRGHFQPHTGESKNTFSRLGLGFSGHPFSSEKDVLVWEIVAPSSDDYQVTLMYDKSANIDTDARLILESGGTQLSVASRTAKIPDGTGRLRLRRDILKGTLSLRAGINTITLRIDLPDHSSASAKQVILRAFSMELVRPEAWTATLKRADDLRSSIDWMVKGKYGLFTHWSPLTYPLHGDVQAVDNYQWGVDNFDVKAYVDMVVETGASWVVFTTAHGFHFWPAPNKTLDRILPGRTSKRDLIMEIADALAEKDIRLMLYYHHGRGDREYMAASGMFDENPTRWFDNVTELHEEVSRRYGPKLWGSGLYVDGSANVYYQYAFPFERLARATKVGNPDSIIGFSFDRAPTSTPFTDLFVMDGSHTLAPPLPNEWFAEGGPYHGVPRAWFPFMDGWVPREPMEGKFIAPQHTPEEYVQYFKDMNAANIPVTINLLITQDVTSKQPFVNPDSLAIMRKIRQAVHGY